MPDELKVAVAMAASCWEYIHSKGHNKRIVEMLGGEQVVKFK
jgi:hypothetical protein